MKSETTAVPMAYEDYFKLSGMLRKQLPVLLSFAIMRCLMGYAVRLWARRCFSDGFQRLWATLSDVFFKATLLASAIFLTAAFVSSFFFLDTWKENTAAARPQPSELICSEFACTRAQGLCSAASLLILCTRSDFLTLALSIAAIKAVTDGTVYVLVVVALMTAASGGLHLTHPRSFFLFVYTLNVYYSLTCYTDTNNDGDRIGGSVLTMTFSSLYLSYHTMRLIIRRIRRSLRLLYTSTVRLAQRLIPSSAKRDD